MIDLFEKSWMKKFLLALAVFLVLLCLAYLPKINHVGYLHDDWSIIFRAETLGSGSMVYFYSIDRPLTGYLVLAQYTLFQTNLPASRYPYL